MSDRISNIASFVIVVAVFGFIGAEFGKAPEMTYSGTQANCPVTSTLPSCQK